MFVWSMTEIAHSELHTDDEENHLVDYTNWPRFFYRITVKNTCFCSFAGTSLFSLKCLKWSEQIVAGVSCVCVCVRERGSIQMHVRVIWVCVWECACVCTHETFLTWTDFFFVRVFCFVVVHFLLYVVCGVEDIKCESIVNIICTFLCLLISI